jgi:twitching motility protein PilU
VRLIDILKEATERKATDIYLVPGAIPCLNLDGVYVPLAIAKGQRLSAEKMLEFAKEATNQKQWDEFESNLELNMAWMSPETDRFRINFFWQRGSIGLVGRRVVADIPTLRQLGLPAVLRNISLEDRGIVLVTGATGSGKSTTLASMIDYRNHLKTGHIVTIEDPVEFVYRHRRSIVTQREVGIDTMSFHDALRNTLRQAPQVICIGELRDDDTVRFAMHASETGHLVFATLHSTNATLAIERILHFFPAEVKDQILLQLSLNLKAILSQRLVPKIGGGRVAAAELLINTPRMQDIIARGDFSAIRQAMAAENQVGIVHFDKSLFRLCRRGLITIQDALQAADSANDLQIKFKGIGVEPGSSWEDTSDPWERVQDDYAPPPGVSINEGTRPRSAEQDYNNEKAPSLPPPRAPGNIARRPDTEFRLRQPPPVPGPQRPVMPAQQLPRQQPNHPPMPPPQPLPSPSARRPMPPVPPIGPRRGEDQEPKKE